MLLIGLGYHFKNQNTEKNGVPIVGESLTLEGSFQGVSSFGKNEKTLHYLEIQLASANKNIHVEDHDLEKLQSFSFGDAITINAAPKVSGSNSLWLLSIQPQ